MAHSSQMIYTRMIGDAPEDEKENEGGVVVSLTVVQDILNFCPSSRWRRKERERRTRQRQKHWQRLRRSWLKLDFMALEGLFSIRATLMVLKACSGHCALSSGAEHQLPLFQNRQ